MKRAILSTNNKQIYFQQKFLKALQQGHLFDNKIYLHTIEMLNS